MPVSLIDIHRNRQQQTSFTGREAELECFRHNFELSFNNEERKRIFAISGIGGVGKTSLLRRFREIAKNNDALTALTDECFKDLPSTLQRIAEDLEKQGFPLKNFTESYHIYRQRQQEIGLDPNLAQLISRLRLKEQDLESRKGKLIVPSLKMAKGVAAKFFPPLDLLSEENIEYFSELTDLIACKLGNKDELGLLFKPLETLTPLFLNDLQNIAEKRQLAFFFDTFEQTGSYLEPWLLRLFEGQYGDLPANIVLVLAGRGVLDPQLWRENEWLMVRIPLDLFTEAEALTFLQGKQVTNPQVVEQILNLSSRLPLLVSMLADQKPTDPQQISDPCSAAVDRFLRWEDPALRRVVIDAALPRCLNRDIMALLKSEEQANASFTWLKGRPFVHERTEGWSYHDVARELMLRFKQREAPQGWAKLQQKLAEYYEKLRDDLGLEEEKGWKDETWQSYALEALYHRLCQAPQKYLAFALNSYLTALGGGERSFALALAETIQEAGHTGVRAKEVKNWGEKLLEGLEAWDENRYEGSVTTFTALLENPTIEAKGRAVALKERGIAYQMMGKYKEALADLNRAIELKPDDAWAFAWRGGTYRRMGQYEEALADLNHALALDPNDAWVIYSRGRVYRRMGKYAEALADSNRSIALKPDDASAITSRARAYQQMGQYAEALADFNRAIELKPDDAWAFAWRGGTYRLMGKYEEALADLNHALTLNPNDAWVIYSRSRIYRRMGKYEEALVDSNRSIALKPEDAWAFALRGRTHRQMRKYEASLADLTRAIELDPKYAWAFAQRGQTYLQMGNYQEAIVDLTHALELDPKLYWTIALRGETYRRMGKDAEAIADFTRAIELEPKEGWLYYSRAIICQTLGQAAKVAEDLAKAIELGQKGYESNPKDWVNGFNLALYHLAAGDFGAATKLYHEGLTGGASQGNLRMAIRDLDQFLGVFPNHAEALVLKAELEGALGK